jgi:hypothetical protein
VITHYSHLALKWPRPGLDKINPAEIVRNYCRKKGLFSLLRMLALSGSFYLFIYFFGTGGVVAHENYSPRVPYVKEWFTRFDEDDISKHTSGSG